MFAVTIALVFWEALDGCSAVILVINDKFFVKMTNKVLQVFFFFCINVDSNIKRFRWL